MNTGRAELRKRRECCEILEGLSLSSVLVVIAVVLGFGVYLHVSAHRTNSCSMTYMYRALQFVEIPMIYTTTNRYSLLLYNEGARWLNRNQIEPNQIPVLFIPGSQGSGKQVRSLASVMQNKTESRRASFSFRFFAVDFDEEMTFMNGNILNRQVDYVMHAVRMIQSMMGARRKVVLVGHSYGGMIATLVAIHEDYYNDIELIITKGSPLNKQPIITDWLSMRLQLFLTANWNKLQTNELRHLGIVAYSGGLRDYMIPDEWSTQKNITHRPLWAIEGVSDRGVDHLAILWCNEFVRHVSRVLYSYGENLNKKTGREVVQQFYEDLYQANLKKAKLRQHINDIPAKEIKLGEKYKGLELQSEQFALVIKPERFQIIAVKVNGSCVKSMTTVRYDETMMHFKNATDGVVESWVYRALANERIHLLLDASLPCKVDVQMTDPMTVHAWRFYEMMFANLLEVGGTFITSCVFFACLIREPSIHRKSVLAMANLAALAAVIHGCSDMNNVLALPMAVGYFLALGWRFVCFLIDRIIFSRLTCIQRGHKALRDSKLTNGMFLVCGALTIVASNEGSIILILMLAYRHHPKAALLVVPAIVPHLMKLVSFNIFSIDTFAFYDLQYHPAFYAGCIYMWGLLCNKQMSQVTMRMLIYGVTPALLYMLSSPLELYSGYALLVLTAARFVPYVPRRIAAPAPEPPVVAPQPPVQVVRPVPRRQNQQGGRQNGRKNQNARRRRR